MADDDRMQVLAIASAGLNTAFGRFERSAERTAQLASPTSDVDYGSEIVEQIGARHAVAANIAVLKAADRMMGELLDILV
ncbi:hypothetical protein [Devosia sp.]|uniref:hypothetical protein n=1 Tax=Devosia sp. TaxID=1871048 RepID=UPI00262865B5|nr:hypothetical protein [Devosia sp.]